MGEREREIVKITDMINVQSWLENQENYNTSEKRNNVKELDISDWDDKKWEEKKQKPTQEKLEGELDLSEFPNLEKLNCSRHKITSLNLTNCSKLIELKCWENELKEIKLPNSLKLKTFYAWTNYLTKIDWEAFDSGSLTSISISNNNFLEQEVSIFSKFTNLEEFCIGNDVGERLEKGIYNRFYGSLKTLENLTRLKKIQIEVTKIKEDFKYLPSNLQVVSWHKQNGLIAKTIPLERLYVIRGNLKQFVKKWGKKEESKIQKSSSFLSELNDRKNNQEKNEDLTRKTEEAEKELTQQEQSNWKKKAENFLNEWIIGKRKNKDDLSELTKLQSPKEIDDSWWTSRKTIYATQFVGRGAAVAGVILSFYDYGALGSGILGLYPFTELVVSNMEKSREDRKSKWNEFLADADNFLDNYNELLGIIDQFKVNKSKKGKVNKALKHLSDKIEEFLDIYDSDGNREVEIDELIEKRYIVFEDLSKKDLRILSKNDTPTLIVNSSSLSFFNLDSNELLVGENSQRGHLEEVKNTLEKIVYTIKELEKAIIEYRKFSYYEEILEKEDNKQGVSDNHQKHESQKTVIDLDQHFAKVEQSPKRGFTV